MTVNPLYDAWKAHGLIRSQGLGGWDVCVMGKTYDFKKVAAVYTSRDVLARQYSWAIPSPKAIKWIVERTKSIVEIGAGRGYWAKLLSRAGAEVFAYDTAVAKGKMGRNGWHNPRSRLAPDLLSAPEDEPGTLYYAVKRGGAKKAAEHPDSTLMLCWHPYTNSMARQCLEHYQGSSLIYIGEWSGCCADSKFFEQLESDWREEDCFEIPQWPGIRDHIWLLRRK